MGCHTGNDLENELVGKVSHVVSEDAFKPENQVQRQNELCMGRTCGCDVIILTKLKGS